MFLSGSNFQICCKFLKTYESMFAFTASEADYLLSHGKQEEFLEGIFSKYKDLENSCDFILCEGSDFKLFVLATAFIL